VNWYQQAIALDRQGNHAGALDLLFDWVDDRHSAGEFAAVDEWLGNVCVTDLSSCFLVGIASITRPAAEHLPSRRAYLDAAHAALEGMGKDAGKLLKHLVGRPL
jgi:hypothetical protein